VAKLIFVHGFSDHVGRYYDLFPSLAERGILVVGYDQRGFGRSVKKPSEKGNTGPTTRVIADLVQVIRSELPSEVPVFVMGHSMGGGEVLTLIGTPEYIDLMPQIRGWLLESPFIGLVTKPNPVTVFTGRLAGKLLPHHQIKQVIPAVELSRDPLVQKSLEEDPMCDGTGTLELFANMLERGANLVNGKTKMNKGVQALWHAHGTGDKVTSYPASKTWLEQQTQLVDKTFKTYEGDYHQLHADLPETRVVFYKDVGDWILSKTGTKESGTESVTKTSEIPTDAPVESVDVAPAGEQAKL
jgi:acylglycerol lipase